VEVVECHLVRVLVVVLSRSVLYVFARRRYALLEGGTESMGFVGLLLMYFLSEVMMNRPMMMLVVFSLMQCLQEIRLA